MTSRIVSVTRAEFSEIIQDTVVDVFISAEDVLSAETATNVADVLFMQKLSNPEVNLTDKITVKRHEFDQIIKNAISNALDDIQEHVHGDFVRIDMKKGGKHNPMKYQGKVIDVSLDRMDYITLEGIAFVFSNLHDVDLTHFIKEIADKLFKGKKDISVSNKKFIGIVHEGISVVFSKLDEEELTEMIAVKADLIFRKNEKNKNKSEKNSNFETKQVLPFKMTSAQTITITREKLAELIEVRVSHILKNTVIDITNSLVTEIFDQEFISEMKTAPEKKKTPKKQEKKKTPKKKAPKKQEKKKTPEKKAPKKQEKSVIPNAMEIASVKKNKVAEIRKWMQEKGVRIPQKGEGTGAKGNVKKSDLEQAIDDWVFSQEEGCNSVEEPDVSEEEEVEELDVSEDESIVSDVEEIESEIDFGSDEENETPVMEVKNCRDVEVAAKLPIKDLIRFLLSKDEIEMPDELYTEEADESMREEAVFALREWAGEVFTGCEEDDEADGIKIHDKEADDEQEVEDDDEIDVTTEMLTNAEEERKSAVVEIDEVKATAGRRRRKLN